MNELPTSSAPLDRRAWLGLTAGAAASLVWPESGRADGPPREVSLDWPQVNGPFGNFNPRQYRLRLLDDMTRTRRLWLSEDRDLGCCKGSSSGYTNHLMELNTHPGTGSGLIVADGKIFASSFRPSGDVWPENHVRIGPAGRDPTRTAEQRAALRRNSAYEADDLTVAIDFTTGRTVWKTVERGQGINRYGGKREHFMVTPAYHDGKVFALGTMGFLYCYDARTGRKLWEDRTGALAREMPALRTRLLRERTQVADGGGMGSSLVVAEGVLIVPQHRQGGVQDIGLRGVDVADGRTLWEAPAATSRYATPAVWTHQGRQYVLTATIRGELRLLEPRTGRILWTERGLTPVYYSLSPSETHVLVNVPSAQQSPGRNLSWGRLAAYRLSPDRAERAWAMPDRAPFWFENHLDICAMRRVQVRDGRVYYFAQNKAENPRQSATYFHILNEQSGAVLLTSRDFRGSPQFFLVEDRMLYSPDAAHWRTIKWQLFTLDPRNFRALGGEWTAPHENTTAYEVFLELPYVAGRFLMRTWQGQVVCYDLRA